MTSREKLISVMSHKKTDKLIFEFGSCKASGISASLLYRLRKMFGRNEPVKIHDSYQMLGLVDERDAEMFGLDIVGIWPSMTCFGYRNRNWKSWTMPDGTPALVGEKFVTTVDKFGDTYLYPQGDITAPPSGKLPKNGFYFDQISRQKEYDEDNLNGVEDYKEQFTLFDEETLRSYEESANYYYKNTSLGIVLNTEIGAFGAATQVLGPMLRHPKGIRNLSDWYTAPLLFPDYVHEIFSLQAEKGIENLKLLKETVGDKAQAIFISSTDFGSQRGLMFSREIILNFYMPYYKKICDWIHENTSWKTLVHCCGAIEPIIGDMCDSGVDCLNPIQCNASGMDPQGLLEKFGNRLVFWGGLVDGQDVLQNGTVAEVEKQIHERIKILSRKNGLVGAIVHNVQQTVPLNNILKVLELVKTYRF
jgi:hypothetical protein